MEASQAGEVTNLLLAWQAGDEEGLQGLTDLVYQDLHRAAQRHMLRERSSHPFQTTDLIHEVYLRLVGAQPIGLQNRAHFLAICARLMRRVLVDFARARGYQKRGDPRKSQVVELRFFGGLSVEETAAALDVSAGRP